LKQGLKWSDGQPLEAEDFVLGIRRTCSPEIASRYQYSPTAVVGCDDYAKKKADVTGVGVRAVDATTIEIKLGEPQLTFTSILAMWTTFPVPKHLVKTHDAPWPAPLQNAYNGPFMPSAYTEKSSMELVPNPNWSGKEKPKVAKIVLRYITDIATANNAYRSGELDVSSANVAQLDVLRSEFPKELISYPATVTIGLHFQHKDPTLAKKEVRLALSQAIDRKIVNDVVNKGANLPTTSWMSAERSGTKAGTYDSVLAFDPQKAKENLAKAGYPDGKGFPKLTLLLVDRADQKAFGEFVQAEWKKHLLIDINLEFVDVPTRSARFNNGEWQLVRGGWGEDYPDPENWMLGLWETGGSMNVYGVSVKELDELLNKAKFNPKDEERRQQYRDAEKILLQGANGIAPLWHSANHFLVKPHIKGMVENKVPNDSMSGGQPAGWNPEYWSTTKK
jgi:oligopeptide transport system substrate-binding protein